jgi:phenylpyruvate tautomerase PptA (4-oxalocrotonate tautomerase family)
MPLVRIDLKKGKPPTYRRAIGDVVYEAMRATFNVPENDRFQVITEHDANDFICDPTYFGIKRTDDCVVIQATVSFGRSVETKLALYKAIVDGLAERIGMRREDVFISLLEVAKENWSFGNGRAQYAE